MANERKYFVKEAWKFNLDSTYTSLKCIEDDIDEGKVEFPFEVTGKVVNDYDELYAIQEEVEDLAWAAKTRKVTGKEYGRIKEIVEWRVLRRYVTCINNGLDESKAGVCFEDL